MECGPSLREMLRKQLVPWRRSGRPVAHRHLVRTPLCTHTRVLSRGVEPLESRALLSVSPADFDNIDPALVDLYEEHVIGAAQEESPAAIVAGPSIAGPNEIVDASNFVSQVDPVEAGIVSLSGDNVYVEVRGRGNFESFLASLVSSQMDVRAADADSLLAEGYLPLSALATVAASAQTISVLPVYSLGATDSVGANSNAGEAPLKADALRNLTGLDGTGITVGVVSDSANKVAGGIYDSITAGDLGPLNSSTFIDQDATTGSYVDEGRAMMELVHDIAPGATLRFYSGLGGEAAFANAVNSLVANGAKVIVDDLNLLSSEPYFYEGLASQAVANAVSSGVTYLASAGNRGSSGYDTAYREFNTTVAGISGEWFDFDSGTGTSALQQITVQPGSTSFTFQFDDYWGAVDTNMDFYVLNSSGTSVIASAISDNIATQVAREVVTINASAVSTITLAVRNTSGGDPGRWKFIANNNAAVSQWANEAGAYVTATNPGHSSLPSVITVAAAAATSPTTPESYSSRGPVTRTRDSAGNSISLQVISKPDITGTDVIYTGVPGYQPFIGTSAAAPNVAAVAAQLLQYNPALTPAQVKSALVSGAIDIDAPGYDTATGAGLVDAVNSLMVLTGGALVVNGNATAADDMTLQVNSSDNSQLDFVLAGVNLATVRKSGISSIQFSGQGGNDSFTVNYANGDPVPSGGVLFDGGTGTDALTVKSGSFTSVAHASTLPAPSTPGPTYLGTGTVTLTGGSTRTITYRQLEDVFDVTSASSVSFAATPGNDNLGVSAGSTVSGVATHKIAASPGGSYDAYAVTSVSYPVNANITIDAGAGNDQIVWGVSPGTGSRSLIGGSGNDVLSGSSSADKLYGGTGDDTLTGGGSNDEYYFSGSDDLGSDTINEAANLDNYDLLHFSGWAYPVNLDLGSTTQQSVSTSGGASKLKLTLSTSSGIEYVIGSESNDTIIGNGRNNYIYGYGGNDVIYGGVGVDTLTGDNGDDTLYGDGDNDTLRGGNGSDNLYGGAGNDSVYGDADADRIYADAGDDYLEGAGGSDEYYFAGSTDLGADTIAESANLDNYDLLHFTGWNYGVTLDLNSTAQQTVSSSSGASMLKLTLTSGAGIEYVVGSEQADTITGNARNNYLYAGSGNDTVYGGAGVDTLRGDNGNDTLYGEDDNDTIYAGAGTDNLYGGNGNDTIYGEADSDRFFADAGDDYLDGGGSNDEYDFVGSADLGADTVVEAANLDNFDQLYFSGWSYAVNLDLNSTAQQTVSTSGGASKLKLTLSSGSGIEYVIGSEQGDTLIGNSRNNYLYGYGGNDTISGGTGNDTLRGDYGDDTLYGDDGNDTINAGFGSDNLYGGNGNDTIYGEGDADRFYADAGDDYLDGGASSDEYYFSGAADLGADTIAEAANLDNYDLLYFGGWGYGISVDVGSTSQQTVSSSGGASLLKLTLSTGSGIEYVVGSAYADTITGNARNNYLYAGSGNDTVYGLAGVDTLRGDAGDDTLYGGDDNDTIYGGAGVDNLYGGNGNDTIYGESETDRFYADAGDDYLDGGASNDEYYFSGTADLGGDTIAEPANLDNYDLLSFSDWGYSISVDLSSTSQQIVSSSGGVSKLKLTLTTSSGIEFVTGTGLDDTITGNSRNNYLYGGGGNDVLHGGVGNDVLRGENGNDVVYGDDGDDTLEGGDGIDELHGNAGNDSIDGGLNIDLLFGGAGVDALIDLSLLDLLFPDLD